ncbi:MAG: CRISPR system precrRNA processing endoribonuclease RAMP protein Cas6 [candidate division KSB1 bacterium]
MSTSPISVNLLRYLIVWRINSPFVWLPKKFAAELSLVLGTIISNRLATNEAGPWRKALAPLQEYDEHTRANPDKNSKAIPTNPWPITATLFPYPGKITYGKEELLLWELKLLGESADHGLFLELLLPAMEEAGYTSDPRWKKKNRLWGNFEVHNIFVARGPHWEPLAREGKLDLRYRPTPVQWQEGLTFAAQGAQAFDTLAWLTPFAHDERVTNDNGRKRNRLIAPSAQNILESLLWRVAELIPGRHNTASQVMASLNADQLAAWQAAQTEAASLVVRHHDLKPPRRYDLGEMIGTQKFSAPFPPTLLRYLELAAILHVGKFAHYGSGAFQVGT